MKFYVFFLFLFLFKYITSESGKNCKDIKEPGKRDDCQLSLYDKKDYKYCCFVNCTSTQETSCAPYTQSDYESKRIS